MSLLRLFTDILKETEVKDKLFLFIIIILISAIVYLMYKNTVNEHKYSDISLRKNKVIQKQDSTILKLWTRLKSVKKDTVILPGKIIRIPAKQHQKKPVTLRDTILTVFPYFDKALVGEMITKSEGNVLSLRFKYHINKDFLNYPKFNRINLSTNISQLEKGKFSKGMILGGMLTAATISVFTNKYKPFLLTTGAVTIGYLAIQLK